MCSTGLWLMSSYLVVKTLGGRDYRGGVVMMLVALCQQLLFSNCGNSADSWVGALPVDCETRAIDAGARPRGNCPR